MNNLFQDLRFGARMLLKKPGFTLMAVLTLAIGIGANTTVFSLLNAAFLKPLPGTAPDHLATMLVRSEDASLNASFSYPDYADLRDQLKGFSGLAAYGALEASLSMEGGAQMLSGEIVTGNYFDVLGVRPALGRAFLPEEDEVPGKTAVVVLSYDLWRDRFGADPGMVGKDIILNGSSYSVTGIAPRGFNSALLGRSSEFWVPVMMQAHIRPASAGTRRLIGSDDLLGERATSWLRVIGRLADGKSFDEALAELKVISPGIAQNSPQMASDAELVAVPLGDEPGLRSHAVPLLTLLFAVVGFVLLIACANVANLMLAQTVARRKEIAIRSALGARRSHLIRQLLTEGMLLAVMGGGAGLLLALWGSDLLYQFDIPRSLNLALDSEVLAFTLLISCLTAIIFGLMPAWFASQTNVSGALKDEATLLAGGSRKRLIGNSLVVLQMALSFMLLVGAGLFLQTLRGLSSANPGFDAEKVMAARIDLDLGQYDETRGLAFYEQLTERVNALPGVESVGFARIVPLSGSSARTASHPADREPPPDSRPTQIYTNIIDRNYFSTMGIRLIQGRDFDERDRAGAPAVAIINQTLAKQFWPDQNPLGKRIRWTGGANESEVIGVVADTRHVTLRESEAPIMYSPLLQQYSGQMALHVRATGDPENFAAVVRREVKSLDSHLPVFNVRTLSEQAGLSVADERLNATSLAVFGMIALGLAAVGLYGVMAVMVNQQKREIGIRMALGANGRDIFRMVIGKGLSLVIIGIATGLGASFAITRLLTSLLFGVSATDPVIFAGVGLLLATVALTACYIPARRATKVDPIIALRYE